MNLASYIRCAFGGRGGSSVRRGTSTEAAHAEGFTDAEQTTAHHASGAAGATSGHSASTPLATRAQRGESLTETLCAILVATLATIVLLTSVSTVANINNKAREHDTSTQEQQKLAEQQSGAGTDGKLVFTNADDSSKTQEITVKCYGADDYISYKYK